MVAIVTFLILVITGIVTYMAFQNPVLYERLMFRPERVLVHKEWQRLFTVALVHGSVLHACFNAIAFYAFAELIELQAGWPVMLVIYLASILGGSLVSLYFHRNHDYSAVGASGGVCGIVFASLFLFPGLQVSPLFIPIPIPGWLFAGLFLAVSYYGMRSSSDNIAHDAHVGGALAGLLTALLLFPRVVLMQPVFLTLTVVGSIIALWLLTRNLNVSAGSVFRRSSHEQTPGRRHRDYEYNRRQRMNREEIDRILDKISVHGFEKLTAREKDLLQRYSDSNRGKDPRVSP